MRITQDGSSAIAVRECSEARKMLVYTKLSHININNDNNDSFSIFICTNATAIVVARWLRATIAAERRGIPLLRCSYIFIFSPFIILFPPSNLIIFFFAFEILNLT